MCNLPVACCTNGDAVGTGHHHCLRFGALPNVKNRGVAGDSSPASDSASARTAIDHLLVHATDCIAIEAVYELSSGLTTQYAPHRMVQAVIGPTNPIACAGVAGLLQDKVSLKSV